MKSKRFTSGVALPLDRNIINATYLIYLSMLESPKLREILMTPKFTDEKYHQTIKELIVDSFVSNVSNSKSDSRPIICPSSLTPMSS